MFMDGYFLDRLSLSLSLYIYIQIYIDVDIDIDLTERERNINLLFHLLTHSMIASWMVPERLNTQPWHIRISL